MPQIALAMTVPIMRLRMKGGAFSIAAIATCTPVFQPNVPRIERRASRFM
ncbi:MAG: hypothetical protein HND58_01085 [Planctomycetota bacterium]|nr:MAG: hypothetical protein HND58_01085 [Planctomycetota bacterium]